VRQPHAITLNAPNRHETVPETCGVDDRVIGVPFPPAIADHSVPRDGSSRLNRGMAKLTSDLCVAQSYSSPPIHSSVCVVLSFEPRSFILLRCDPVSGLPGSSARHLSDYQNFKKTSAP
jgi:hypothetical protein